MKRRLDVALFTLFILSTALASAQTSPTQEPDEEGALALVAHAHVGAEHAPGTEPHFKGVQAYEAGRFWQARNYFTVSARFADKMSQFYMGLIHFNGDGLTADHARGWAWFQLSAERGYPQMMEIADRVWDQLSPQQRDRGRQILEQELLPEFGDAVTVQRTARRMRQNRLQMTGSRLGTTPGLMEIYEGPVDPDAAGSTGTGTARGASTGTSPNRSRYDFYAEDEWDFYAILEREARVFKGFPEERVRLGEFEVLEPDDADDSKRAD